MILYIIGLLATFLFYYLLAFCTYKIRTKEKVKMPNIIHILIILSGCIPLFNFIVGLGGICILTFMFLQDEVIIKNWLFK